MEIIAPNKLNASINSVVKALSKSGAQLHVVAYSCLSLIETAGDVRPLQRLYDNLPGTVYGNALKAWATAYGKVTVKYAETDEAKARPIFTYAKGGKSDLESAAAVPVMDFKPEAKAAAEFDLEARLASLLKAAEKAGAHLKHVAAYKLLMEAEQVLTGANVVEAKPRKAQKPAAEQKAAA